MHSHGRAIATCRWPSSTPRPGLAGARSACQGSLASQHRQGRYPRTILDKSGPLNDEEWAFVRTRTELGERIIGEAPSLPRAPCARRAPRTLLDETAIRTDGPARRSPSPPASSLPCDAFDAMTSVRPYRVFEENRAEAVDELRRCAGSQFDPEVIDALEGLGGRWVPTSATLQVVEKISSAIPAPCARSQLLAPGRGADSYEKRARALGDRSTGGRRRGRRRSRGAPPLVGPAVEAGSRPLPSATHKAAHSNLSARLGRWSAGLHGRAASD